MRLVVGLGNPGERYRRTRHNMGYMVVDTLAARAGVRRGSLRRDAWVAEVQLAGQPTLLVKPLTFMNRSGMAVAALLGEQRGGPGELVLVVDDVALELGTLRLRERGSHGGHNGLRSVSEVLESDDFVRLRVGIRNGDPPEDLAGYVLADFSEDEVLTVQEAVGRAADVVETLLRDGPALAMSRYNGPRKL